VSNIILKEIPDFPGYKAGSDGHIYSYFKSHNGYDYSRIPKKRKSHPYGTGRYLFVGLRKNDKTFQKSVHRLVCLSFNGPSPEDEYDCSHLNGNDKDNRPENLIWESRKDNHFRKKLHGTDDIGIKNTRAMFTLEQIVQIKKWLKEGITTIEIGKRMGCNYRNIGKIKRGEHYKGQGEIL